MKRLILFLLLFSSCSWAQFTTVTGTVTDPNNLPYAGGTIMPRLVLPGGTSPTLNGGSYTPPTQPVGLDGTGSFTVQLADNAILLPGGTTWNFQVCSSAATVQPASGKGPVCFSVTGITITGASQSLTATLTAAALPLTNVPPSSGGTLTKSIAVPSGALTAPTPLGADSTCPGSFQAFMWIKDTAGNYEPTLGRDTTTSWANGPAVNGFVTTCRPWLFVSGPNAPDFSPNGALAIYKRPVLGDTVGMQAQLDMSGSDANNYNTQLLTFYAEMDPNGSGTYSGGSPFGQVNGSVFRGVIDNLNSGNNSSLFAFSGQFLRDNTSQHMAALNSPGNGVFYAIVQSTAGGNAGGGNLTDYYGAAGNTGGASGISYVTFLADVVRSGSRMPGGNYGFFSTGFGSNSGDYSFYASDVSKTAGQSYFGGNVELGQISTAWDTIPVNGALALTSSLNTAQLSAPSGLLALATQGTPGATVWAYDIAACDGNGVCIGGEAGGPANINTGNATLNSTNNIKLTIGANQYAIGTSQICVWRTGAGGTPNTTGKIGCITVTLNSGNKQILTFVDTGLPIIGASVAGPPTYNDSGASKNFGLVTLTDCASSAAPAVCGSASSGSAVIAAAATTVTINTTAVGPNSEIFLQTDDTLGTKLSVTCNSTVATLVGGLTVTSRTANTSFQVTSGATPAVNPLCFHYDIRNPGQ